jgi:hypothetical protein
VTIVVVLVYWKHTGMQVRVMLSAKLTYVELRGQDGWHDRVIFSPKYLSGVTGQKRATTQRLVKMLL